MIHKMTDDIVAYVRHEKAPWDAIGITRIEYGFQCNGCGSVFQKEVSAQIHCALHGRYIDAMYCKYITMIPITNAYILICRDCGDTVPLKDVQMHEQAHVIYVKDTVINPLCNPWTCQICNYRHHFTHLTEHARLHIECPKHMKFEMGSDGAYQMPVFRCKIRRQIIWFGSILNEAKSHSEKHERECRVRAYTFRLCQRKLEDDGICITLPADSTYEIMRLILNG